MSVSSIYGPKGNWALFSDKNSLYEGSVLSLLTRNELDQLYQAFTEGICKRIQDRDKAYVTIKNSLLS